MTVQSARHQSVARRTTLMAITLVMVVLTLMGVGIYLLTERSTRSEIAHSIGNTVQSVAQSIDAADGANHELVQATMRGFHRYFEARMHLDPNTGELRSYGAVVNGDSGSVDRFASETDGIASVFARQGDQFVRVTTSIKDAKGERINGTRLESDDPAFDAVRAGKPFVGRSVVQGKSYMGHYQPIQNHENQLVGALFVGTDLSVFDAMLEKQVEKTRFFETGSAYVIDPRSSLDEAVFIAHPTAKGQRVLQAYPQVKGFLEALSQAPEGQVQGAIPLLVSTQGPVMTLIRKAANGWWVVAEVPYSEAMSGHEDVMWAMWAMVAAALVILASGLFLVLRKGVADPLRGLTRAITAVAHGNLTQPFHTHRRDEIGALVQEVEGMRQRYLQMLNQVRFAVDNVTTASKEIAQGNQDLSNRTEATASSLAQTAQSMEQLSQTVRQSADSARQANALAGSAAEVAARGGKVVSEVVSTMEEINQSARRIADIIGVIDGIAFQTNILALNAAVEAARAGEQGRGFAVVAGEVRALAGRSAEAAREIRHLIGASVERVDSGTRLVSTAGTTMDEIVGSVRQVGDIIGEVTAAAAEQSDGIAQVSQAVHQLDQMTQQNATLVEESAAAAQSLRDQAGQLVVALEVFQLDQQAASDMPDPPSLKQSLATSASQTLPSSSAYRAQRVVQPLQNSRVSSLQKPLETSTQHTSEPALLETN